jgi:MFS family permease
LSSWSSSKSTPRQRATACSPPCLSLARADLDLQGPTTHQLAGQRRVVQARRKARRTLPNRVAYALAAAVVGLGQLASGTPSPLYHTYSALWHFSPLTLTLIFATFACGALAALLLAGRVSDEVGRRPVLLVALGVLMISTVLFMVADSVAWLFAARGIQGLATGAALSAASATLLDLHPRRDPAGVGLTTAVASPTGAGLGVLVSSSLVQLGSAPLVVPYVVLLVLFAIAFVGVYWMPEPVLERSRFRLTPQRPSIPKGVRGPFLLAALAALSSWSVFGLFFSLGPALAAHLFNTSNVIASGAGLVALAGSAALAQLLLGRTAPWIGVSAGSVALAAGMILIVVAAAIDSSAAFLAGSVLGGIGFGIDFLGGLRALTAVIPHEHRAAVISAFYVAAYAGLSVPAVIAGVVVTDLGLQETFEIFGSVVAGLALIVAVEAWRTRPARPRAY